LAWFQRKPDAGLLKPVRIPAFHARRAFTITELLVVLALVVIFFFMMRPVTVNEVGKPRSVQCRNNQKQVALGQIMWLSDHADRFPWEVPTAEGGTREQATDDNAAIHFKVLSNYVAKPPVFVCPTDPKKLPANTVQEMVVSNLSFFANLDAIYPTRITNRTVLKNWAALMGDRHLKLDGRSAKPGVLVIRSNSSVAWTRELHSEAKKTIGTITFVDGHAEKIMENLTTVFHEDGMLTRRLVVP
jgi:type II secretory pathway pseudopilin PulG